MRQLINSSPVKVWAKPVLNTIHYRVYWYLWSYRFLALGRGSRISQIVILTLGMSSCVSIWARVIIMSPLKIVLKYLTQLAASSIEASPRPRTQKLSGNLGDFCSWLVLAWGIGCTLACIIYGGRAPCELVSVSTVYNCFIGLQLPNRAGHLDQREL